METRTKRLDLLGEVVGVGVDIVVRGRVSARLSERRFSLEERAHFADRLEIPFAARESLVKAVGGPGMLGAPLREMNVAPDGQDLRLVPGPKYLAVLREQAVSRVWMSVLSIDDAYVIVAAIALRGETPSTIDIAWSQMPIADADRSLLTGEERALADGRPDPRASIATRHCARNAARALVGSDVSVSVHRGGDDPPELLGVAGAKVSLAHEDDLALALVCVVSP